MSEQKISTEDARELARSSDPVTSHEAAESLSQEVLSRQKEAILSLLTLKPSTDRELTARYFDAQDANGWPNTDRDSVRKRRAQLKNAGRVEVVGITTPTTGKRAQIWGVAA